ncbi:PaaI family thioesterase [Halomarina oriensis]|uniref:Hotdog fold thioesterase n=1 Tax=Halomarina oriensis TaxID=671145 RepID=A0A6B0GRJ1_9EURY|nr:PaaI family thioesterase [Halomarina oriensis]MWG34288.1 hotdog fold thioesterase [Halomarina oriensis]
MSLVDAFFDSIPFANHLGIELDEVGDGRAVGHVDLQEEHSSNPGSMIAHGGVAYSLADTIGGAAVVDLNETVTPTIDMRIDYLAPATGERLVAEAEVTRNGNSVATVTVDIEDGSDTHVATARGVYKTGGVSGETPWTAGQER